MTHTTHTSEFHNSSCSAGLACVSRISTMLEAVGCALLVLFVTLLICMYPQAFVSVVHVVYQTAFCLHIVCTTLRLRTLHSIVATKVHLPPGAAVSCIILQLSPITVSLKFEDHKDMWTDEWQLYGNEHACSALPSQLYAILDGIMLIRQF